MALTIEEVRKIAILARLRLSSEEEGKFVGQLGHIVDYIDQLQSFAGALPEPTATPVLEAADVVRACLPRPEFLANAPDILGGFLLVPEIKAGEGKPAAAMPDIAGGSGER